MATDRFYGLIGGGGIGYKGVKALEEADFELVCVAASRPGLSTMSGQSASFHRGDKPGMEGFEEDAERMFEGRHVQVMFNLDGSNETRLVVIVQVGSAGTEYPNIGYFVGQGYSALNFVRGLPLSYESKFKGYNRLATEIVGQKPRPMTQYGQRALGRILGEVAEAASRRDPADRWIRNDDEFATEVRMAWAKVMAQDLARVIGVLTTDVGPYENDTVFGTGSLPEYERDLEALRAVFVVK